MKNKEDKNIEKLVENMMKETTIETPSFDFTSKVMSEVLAIQKKKSFSYTPVISKRGWFILFAIIGSLTAWIIFNGNTQTGTAINFDLSFIKFEKVFNIANGLKFSNTTANIILLAIAMLFVQIILLKSHLNKRFHK